jgi:acyl carrier protein
MLEQLQSLLREYLDNSDLILNENTVFTELGLDSYDMTSLLGTAEEHFGVEISDRALMEIVTAGDFANYLAERLKDRK